MNTIKRQRQFPSNQIFDVTNVIIMLMLLVIFAFPLWFVLIASISDPTAVNAGKVLLIPKDIMLNGYVRMMKYKQLWSGYANTIFYTVVGTALNMIMSVCLAYPMADKEFVPRKILMVFFMITMYFSGGLIPSYLLLKQLGIVNTRLAMIVPGLVSVYNSLIIRSFFMNSIPKELKESATLDGANAAQYLYKVVLPLSKSVFAVVGLYYMVGHWNDFANALYYLYDEELYPLQSVLRNLLISSKLMADMASDPEAWQEAYNEAQSMKYCVIIAASLPMLCVYPFIQKHLDRKSVV